MNDERPGENRHHQDWWCLEPFGLLPPVLLASAPETLIVDALHVYNLHIENERVHFKRLLSMCTRIYL